jgi:hypothetical protein
MMSQVRNCKILVLCSFILVALVGCKEKEQPVNPYVDPGTTENPNWTLSGDNDMSASMTAIVKVSFTKSAGSLAAFIGNDCCGIANYNTDLGLYWLYISPAKEAEGNVQLRFYSPDLKRIFVATSTFPFRNDSPLGYITEPYTPEWKEMQ